MDDSFPSNFSGEDADDEGGGAPESSSRRYLFSDYFTHPSATEPHCFQHLFFHFSLLMTEVMGGMDVLEGPEGGKYVSSRIDLLHSGMYTLAGKFVLWSIQQRGPGIPCLSRVQYDILTGRTTTSIVEAIDSLEECGRITQVITQTCSHRYPADSHLPPAEPTRPTSVV